MSFILTLVVQPLILALDGGTRRGCPLGVLIVIAILGVGHLFILNVQVANGKGSLAGPQYVLKIALSERVARSSGNTHVGGGQHHTLSLLLQ